MRLPSKDILINFLSLFLFTIMITSHALNATAPTETVVKVETKQTEFGNSNGDAIPIPGTKFDVTVKIYNVTNLYGLELKFRWNATFLRYVSHTVHIPRDTYPDGVLWNPVLQVMDEVNASAGTYQIAYASIAPAPSFNGSGTVFTMTLEIINQPYDYETGTPGIDPVVISLDFSSTDLAAFGGDPIQHTSKHATITIWEKKSQIPSYPVLKVMPSKVGNLPVCSTFNISIWILGISTTYNVANFSITLNFNSTLLKAEKIVEGPWPKNYAKNSTTISEQIDNVNGTVTYSVELIPPKKPDPPSAGVLFIVNFHVIYESPTYPPPSCELAIGSAEIFDRDAGLIQYLIENSTFTALAPLFTAKFTWIPPGNILQKGQIITFNASESYLPTGIKHYIWNFGDGIIVIAENPIVIHVYQVTATMKVVLNVTDGENLWAVATVTLYIVDDPQAPPVISVINLKTRGKNFEFYTNTTSVGSRFNITIYIYNVADLEAYQIHLKYNATLLNSTRAWLPTWNTTWVFYGKQTTGQQPIFGQGYVQIADAIKGYHLTFSGNGILCIIEFEIIYVPTKGEISCSLDINNTDTFLLDSNWNEILSTKVSGNYIYAHKKIGSKIFITISPSIINFGENITMTVVLDPPRSTNVTLLYRFEKETAWKNLVVAPTNNEGRYAHTWMPPKAGSYTVVASWSGDENTEPANVTEILIVNKAAPILTINVFPKNVVVGSNVVINGSISVKGIKFNITIQFKPQEGLNWNSFATTQTNILGHYSYTWKPDREGTYELRTIWLGDENTLPAQSQLEVVNVKSQPTSVNPYIVTGTVMVALIIALGTFLLKRKHKQKYRNISRS